MAESGKETVPAAPPPPRETEAMDRPSLTAIADGTAPATIEPPPQAAPAAVLEPGEGTTTPPPPPKEAQPAAAVASGLDTAPPTAESSRRGAPPQEEEHHAAAAAGQSTQTTAKAGGEPPTATEAEEPAAALPPPPSTAAVEAEKPVPAPAAPPPQQPPQSEQEGGAADETSSARYREEEEDAAAVRAPEGGEKKPEEKLAAAAAQDGRRRWRHLQAAVRLIFLPCKRVPCGGDQSTPQSPLPEHKGADTKPPAPTGKRTASGREEKKPTPAHEGATTKPPASGQEEKKPAPADEVATKPPAVDGKQPASGKEQVATSPPAAETPPLEEKAGEAAKPVPAPPPQKQEGGAPEQASSAQEEEKGAAQATAAQDGEQKPPRRRWRLLRCAVKLLFLRTKPKDGEGKAKPQGEESTGGADGKGKQPASEPEEGEKPKPPHPKWAREEQRLEQILEDAFTRLLAAEYHELRPIRKKCLLTFSVFDLAAEVKKQAMVYWWVSEFNLLHRSDQSPNSDDAAAPAATETARSRRRRNSCWQQARKSKAAGPAGGDHQSPAPPPPRGNKQAAGDGGGNNNPDADAAAEGIISELSSHGFLEPMKNWCSRTIHGCKVNPLVHWMVKRRARDDRFAVLDGKGSPDVLQPDSRILCLTAGNRALLQMLRMEDVLQEAGNKLKAERTPSSLQQSPTQDKATEKDQKDTQSTLEHEEISRLFKGRQVILNVNAHVYPVSKSTFLHLADCLVVLQLGRWCNHDDDTYMEVDGLESLSTIGSLKNLRYLSLRGLSRLTKLPVGIRLLKKLVILDMRGCQNLVKVASKITRPLKQLTHLDLTECYMLEHIDRGIISLSELQVFKGFVFATGTQGNNACRLQDLQKLKKLQKLTISITTDANVGKDEMAELKNLASLHKLTITWSEVPSILDGDSDTVKKKRVDLIKKWTSFDIPQELFKLDLRCYPKKELKLKVQKSLKKLYLRGGDLERFSIDESNLINSSEKTNSIETLRLRYLKNFNMEWEDIRSSLKNIEYVEIVSKDEKLMEYVKDTKNTKEEGQIVKNIEMKYKEEKSKLVKKKKIIYSTLDENGVWVKDNEEEEYLRWTVQSKEKEDKDAMEKSKGVNNNDTSNATKEQSGGKGEQVATNEVPQELKTEPTP